MTTHCPKCRAPMAMTDVICPACGYDFPDPPPAIPRSPRDGLIYSDFANFALIVAQVLSGLAALVAALSAIAALFNAHWLEALVYDPLLSLFLFALMITFARILDLTEP